MNHGVRGDTTIGVTENIDERPEFRRSKISKRVKAIKRWKWNLFFHVVERGKRASITIFENESKLECGINLRTVSGMIIENRVSLCIEPTNSFVRSMVSIVSLDREMSTHLLNVST